jgi:regulator of protease activity HflC (stomatin/prohibitin superfamily)
MKVVVNEREAAILFRDGRYAGPLAPGVHRFSTLFEQIEVKKFRRRQWIYAMRVEAVSAEKFPVRLALGVACELIDANLADENEYLIRVQLSLGAQATAVAAKIELDTLLTAREDVARQIEALVVDAVPGCKLSQVQVTGVMMPPEVRRLFTDVERARREGEAALARAHAEQASLRALANAARMLKGNPELMNLRLLQAVGGDGKSATLVLGGEALAKVSPAAE